MKFNFNDIFIFDFSGKGILFDYLIFQFDYFKSKKAHESNKFLFSIDFICDNKVLENKNILKKFNDKKNAFSKTECGSFIYNVGDEFVIFDGGANLNKQKVIYFSENFPKMIASMIVDFIFRIHLTSLGIVLLHAAALTKKDEGVLIPSWKGMGKTALTLKLVQSGCEYMADDRVWLSDSGVIYAYPRYVVLKDSNYIYFPQFITFKMKIKMTLMNITNLIIPSKIKYFRYIKKIVHRFFKINAKHYHIQSLLPNAKVVKQSKLKSVLTLYRDEVENILVKKMLPRDAVRCIDAVNKYEWDAMLMSIFTAHDALFNSGFRWQDEHLKLIENDENVLIEALSPVSCYEGILPQIPSGESFDDLVIRINKL